jgi:hypothetical protein
VPLVAFSSSSHRAPNPRLQRTRSAPLRSPLSRKPFGVSRSKRIAVALPALAVSLLSCAGPSWVGYKPLASPHPHEDLTFFVYSQEPKNPVVGGLVLAAGPGSGTHEIGKTNADGQFHIAKGYIRDNHVDTLIFCLDQPFPCSAVRVGDPQVLGFDELNVNIPVYAMINRVQIH